MHFLLFPPCYQAEDEGYDEVTVTIDVQDENNNAPVFTREFFIGGEHVFTWQKNWYLQLLILVWACFKYGTNDRLSRRKSVAVIYAT